MRFVKVTFTLLGAMVAIGWITAQTIGTTAADPAIGTTDTSPTVIDASEYPDLQAAFDAVPMTGGLVKLPPGDFRLTEPLVLERPETRIEGAGAATKLINCNQEGKPALIVRPPNLADNPRAFVWRVQLADFRICGDPNCIDAKSSEPKSGDGLLAQRVNEIYIEGLSVDHNGGHGINLVDCLEDARVCNSIMTYNRQAGLNILGAHDIVVNANQFEENNDAVLCIKVCNLCMNGNNIDDHLRHGVVIETTYGSVLSGNMIEECQGTAVVLDRDCHGITVSANVIAHNFGGGVDLRDAWGCTVSANTFTVDEVRGVVVGPDSGRITITGNNFSDRYIGEGKYRSNCDDPASGIQLEGTSDIAISGNVFAGLNRQAIEADAECQRVAIIGNVMTDLNRKTDEKRPALDLRDARETIVEHNSIAE
ncbi:MAG: right-handed parallel beta-helix repeat-containing protein [Planctomycetes bacterium]|nr:right-handed parallel beta-helix repeat-containing protein [Planctomycetota bacterium]